MGEQTGIEWCDHTFNPWIGCARVSPGCRNCYAEHVDERFRYGGETHWGQNAPRMRTSPGNWRKPVAWDRKAAADGVRRRVFCASLADVFEDRRDLDPWRNDLWTLIEQTPHLDWLLLTKRPENMWDLGAALWFCECGENWNHHDGNACLNCETSVDNRTPHAPANVWLGTTVESAAQADRVTDLVDIAAPVHFVSCEPLLGDVANEILVTGIDWVICGGESGPGARPMHPDWARSLRDQCDAAGVPFLFKQWGELVVEDQSPLDITLPGEAQLVGGDSFYRVGKKAAGRQLDGRTWDEFPTGDTRVHPMGSGQPAPTGV